MRTIEDVRAELETLSEFTVEERCALFDGIDVVDLAHGLPDDVLVLLDHERFELLLAVDAALRGPSA